MKQRLAKWKSRYPDRKVDKDTLKNGYATDPSNVTRNKEEIVIVSNKKE